MTEPRSLASTASPASPEALLREHLATITHDHPRWLALFADDAVVEFPYAPSVGRPARLEGKTALDAYFGGAGGVFVGLTFRDVVVHVAAASAASTAATSSGIAIAEAHGTATIAPTGKIYEQDYVMVLEARDGKIVRYREYWNPMSAIEAFGGADALPKIGSGS